VPARDGQRAAGGDSRPKEVVVGLVSSWPAGVRLGALAAGRVPCGGCRARPGATRQ
jgi:hypothetical protein